MRLGSWLQHHRRTRTDGIWRSTWTPLGPAAYDINSPPKVTLRRERREAIDESLHVLATVPQLLE